MATDVCIVGAGPTGLMAALALHHFGVKNIRLIDRLESPSPFSKALVLHARSLELLTLLGIVDDFLAVGEKIKYLNFSLEKEEIELPLCHIESPYPFALALSQNHTEELLTKALTKAGISVERGSNCTFIAQDGSQVTLTIEGKQPIEASWVIAADGGHSTIRHVLGMNFQGDTLEETFALADVHIKEDLLRDRLHFFYSEEGIAALFPFDNDKWRIILPGIPETASHEPILEDLERILSERAKQMLRLDTPSWLSYFTVNSRQIPHYQMGRIFFAGDAAHVHSPVGGQGMNTGIQDSINLAWKLALVIAHKVPFSFLKSYEEERLPVAHEIVTATESMTRLLTSKASFARWAREKALPKVLSTDFIQRFAARKTAELDIVYKDSDIVEDTSAFFAPGKKAGERVLPGFFDEALKKGRHLLVLFTADHTVDDLLPGISAIQHRALDFYREIIDPYLVVSDPIKEAPWPVLVDAQLNEHQRWKVAHQPALYLLRPDGYIGFSSHPMDVDRLIQYLSRFFISEKNQRLEGKG